MEFGLFALLLVCVAVPMATGLKCYTCTDINLETDNDQVNALLSGQIPRDEACGNDDISGLKLEDCGDGFPGKTAACTKSRGEASASVASQSITVTTTTRGCTAVSADTKDTCQTSSDESALKAVPGMQGIDVDSFEATMCICTMEGCNGQTTLAPAITTCLVSLVLAVFALW